MTSFQSSSGTLQSSASKEDALPTEAPATIVLEEKKVLTLTLFDTFGKTAWAGATIVVTNVDGTSTPYSPDAAQSNPLSIPITANQETIGSVSFSVSGFPKVQSALVWTVTNELTGQKFEGSGVDSFLSLDLNGYSATLKEAANTNILAPGVSTTCKACTAQYYQQPNGAGGVGASGGAAAGDDNKKGKNNNNNNNNKKKNGRRLAGDLSVLLYGAKDTWWSSDSSSPGTTYEIASTDGTTVYYAGTLCGDETTGGSACDINLPQGSYVWRVGGALDANKASVSWSFCNTHGGALTELSFDIDPNLQCIPSTLSFSAMQHQETKQESYVSRTITLTAHVKVFGLSTDDLSDAETALLATSLANPIGLASHNSVKFASSERISLLSKLGGLDSQNEEDVKTTRVDVLSFSLTFTSASWGTEPAATNVAIQTLVSHVRTQIEESMESGNFLNYVLSMADKNGYTGLETVSGASLLDVEVTKDIEYSEEDVTQVNAFYSVLANSVIVVGLAMGVIFGVATFRATMKDSGSRDGTTSGGSQDEEKQSNDDGTFTSTEMDDADQRTEIDVSQVGSKNSISEKAVREIPIVITFGTIHDSILQTGDGNSRVLV